MPTNAQRLDGYANYLRTNAASKGSPEFEKVAAAYRSLRTGSGPAVRQGTLADAPLTAETAPDTRSPEIKASEQVRDATNLPLVTAYQGATFGLGDELAGVASAATGGTYAGGRDDVRMAEAEYRRRTPTGAIAANLAGGLLAAGGAIKAAPGLFAPAGATTGGNIVRGVAGGAGAGAVSGFGSGEGGFENRALDAGVGAGVGGILGGVIPTAVAGYRGVFPKAPAAIARGVGKEDRAALGIVGKALERDRMTPADFQTVIDANAGSGKPLTLADMGGENVRGTLDSVLNRPGEARALAAKIFAGRQTGRVGPLGMKTTVGPSQAERLQGDVKDSIADAGFFDTIEKISAARAKAAAPLYQKAYEAGEFSNPRIEGLLKTPAGRSAFEKALTLAQNEAGSAEPELVGELVKAADFLSSPKAPGSPIPMRVLDLVKRGLDDVVESHMDPITRRIETEAGRSANAVRGRFKTELESVNPAYRDALASYAGPSAMIDKIRRGRDAFKPGMSPEQIAKDFGALSPEDQSLFKIGAARHFMEKIEGTPQSTNNAALRVLTGSDHSKLRAILPTEQHKAFIDAIEREKAMYTTAGETMGNSATFKRAAAAGDMDEQTFEAMLADGATKGGYSISEIAGRALKWLRERGTGMSNEGVRKRVGEYLLSSDPTKQKQALQWVQMQMQNQRSKAISGGALASGQGMLLGSSFIDMRQSMGGR